MCECYQIGGRFIAEDPDCPAHGITAHREEKLRDQELIELRERIFHLEYLVRELQDRISYTGRE